MLHPHTRLGFISDAIGLGVVATELIPAGTLTWVLDPLDRVLAPEQTALLHPIFARPLDRYCFTLATGAQVLCWDNARYVNHSCDPNCASPWDNIELAIRDIEPGEQLTNDYSTLNLDQNMACLCGSRACRETIQHLDYDRVARRLDERLESVRHSVGEVHQPLLPLLDDAGLRELATAAAHGFPSVRSLFYTRSVSPQRPRAHR